LYPLAHFFTNRLRYFQRTTPSIRNERLRGDQHTVRTLVANKGKPQLAMFNDETTPNLDMAVAVNASAALPPVLAPVNIRLPSGVTVRFEDRGVMNNAPTSDLVGAVYGRQREYDERGQSVGGDWPFSVHQK
jgi:predicted acylesterase/phospholipase RssA